MDGKRFDEMARILVSAASRRRAVALILGGAVSLSGMAGADDVSAAASKQCQPACADCTYCKKGKCRKTKHRKRCKPGKCLPKADGAPCALIGGSCLSATCTCPTGQEACGGVCLDLCPAGLSVRNPVTCGCCRVNLLPLPVIPCGAPFPCCSEICVTIPSLPPQSLCVPRATGDPCQFGAQCASGVCASNGQCAA
jgi:hypothetical protein